MQDLELFRSFVSVVDAPFRSSATKARKFLVARVGEQSVPYSHGRRKRPPQDRHLLDQPGAIKEPIIHTVQLGCPNRDLKEGGYVLGTVHDLAEIERVNHSEQRFDDLPDRRLAFDWLGNERR